MRLRLDILLLALALLTLWRAQVLAQGDDTNALLARAEQLTDAAKYAEAMPLAQKALELTQARFGQDHPSVAFSINLLGRINRLQGRFGEAEALYKQALAIREKALGANHALTAVSLNNLGVLYFSLARFEEAEPLYKRSQAIKEKTLPAGDLEIAIGLNNLAENYRQQGKLAEAEPLFKQSLLISEKTPGPEKHVTAAALNNLALLYSSQGRNDEALKLNVRALQVREKLFGAEHPEVAQSLANLAAIHLRQRRYAEAEPLLKRSLSLNERTLGGEHPDTASSVQALGDLYRDQDRFAEAEPLLKRGLAIRERVLGADNGVTLETVASLGLLYRYQAKYKEAEPLFRRALAAREKSRGPRHPAVGASHINLAALHYHDRNYATSLDHARRGAQIIIDSEIRSLGVADDAGPTKTSREDALRGAWRLNWLVLPAWRVAEQRPAERTALAEEAFATAQWIAHNSAGGALAQMAARQAKGESGLAQLVREQQDLIGEWQAHDKLLVAALALPPGRRDQQREAVQRTRLAAIDARIGEIHKILAKEFPDYAALANGEVLSVAATQALLAVDEVVLVFLGGDTSQPAPPETFLWAIAKSEARWVKIDGGAELVARQVQALRCGLDQAAWEGEGAS
jgi:tetratricopeptide (TPR) repeat protein